MTTMAEMERKIESLEKRFHELEKRQGERYLELVSALEKRVQELEKRPAHEVHYHTHHDAPAPTYY